MPSAHPELQQLMNLWFAKPFAADADASDFLRSRGYRLTSEWEWLLPSSEHSITPFEMLCITYLIDEWDYGGIAEPGIPPLTSTTEGPR